MTPDQPSGLTPKFLAVFGVVVKQIETANVPLILSILYLERERSMGRRAPLPLAQVVAHGGSKENDWTLARGGRTL
jgi:hypothetical protein